MNDFESAKINCPYCGERIEVLLDREEEGESYIEDCSVCCCPITMLVTVDEQGNPSVEVHHENDT